MISNVVNMNPKLRQENQFHDEIRQAGLNIIQSAQFIIDNDGINEALFYLDHIKNQLLKMNEENKKEAL